MCLKLTGQVSTKKTTGPAFDATTPAALDFLAPLESWWTMKMSKLVVQASFDFRVPARPFTPPCIHA